MWQQAFKGELIKLANHAQFSLALKSLLQETGVSPNEVVVGGSGILGGLGKRPIGDLDVWATSSAFSRLTAHPNAVTGTAMFGQPKLTFAIPAGEIEVFTGNWLVEGQAFHGLDQTIDINGIPHWSPEKTLAWKQKMNRAKDQEDIRLLKEYVATSF